MKKLFLIISLLIALALLSACATPMTATPTAFPETTSTSIPTSIPPTATIEPSPTVDPNMPEGATGKDANGNYTKTTVENGNTITWTWTKVEDNFSEWTHRQSWTTTATSTRMEYKLSTAENSTNIAVYDKNVHKSHG